MRALMLALVAVLAACDPSGAAPTREAHPSTLAGTHWTVVAIGGTSVPAGPAGTLDVEADRVAGSGGCNAFGGSYTYDPSTGALRIGELVSTKRACLQAGLGGREDAYFAALRGATGLALDEAGRLVITGTGPALVLAVAAATTSS